MVLIRDLSSLLPVDRIIGHGLELAVYSFPLDSIELTADRCCKEIVAGRRATALNNGFNSAEEIGGKSDSCAGSWHLHSLHKCISFDAQYDVIIPEPPETDLLSARMRVFAADSTRHFTETESCDAADGA